MKTQLVLLVLAVSATFTNSQFPPFIKLCKRNSNINECVKENILIARKYVKQGIPKLFVHPANPFKITSVYVETPTLKAEMSKFKAYNMHQFDLRDLNIDLENNKFEIDLAFKHLEATTRYKFNGQVIGIPVNGGGAAYGNITDFGLKVSLSGTRMEQNGKTYITFDQKSTEIVFDTCYLSFQNLFPNRELTEVANHIINENIKAVVEEMQPLIEESFVTVISDSITILFEKYSIDELFPL